MSISIGKMTKKLYFGTGLAGGTCDKMLEAKAWRLSESVRLPVTVFVQTYRYYDAEPETVTAAQERTEMVRRALGAAAEPDMVRRGEKWHIDLKGINALWLRQAGVQRIDVCPDCTGCHPERWWSHRKMGDRRGAQAALIALI